MNNSKLNLTLLPNEIRLLLCMLKDNCDDEADVWLEEGVDWKLFIQLVRHHRVYPNIYHRLKEMSDLIPADVIQHLYKDYQKNTYQMLFLSAEMEKLSSEFSMNEINAIFLKGPTLANELYGDVSLRTSSDLDILVPIQELKNIDHLLTQNGYVKDEYIRTILNDWKWRHHHFSYYHFNKNVKIEVHWRLNPGPAKEPSFNELWERKRICKLTSTPTFILGKEDLFLFLVLHGGRHGWSRLRWLVDIKQFINQTSNWIGIYKILKKYRSLHIAGQAVILASQLLETPIPIDLTPLENRKNSHQLAQDALFYLQRMINLHTEPIPEEVAEYHNRHLFSLMPLKQKILVILSFLFPYPIDAETLSLPKKFHFLYFPLRPLLCLWRKTKKALPEGAKR